MGQATVDLPDPIDLPPVDHVHPASVSAAALASADDLLSQLAGEDIDRLLAEAETAAHAPIIAKLPQAEPPKNEKVAESSAVVETIEPPIAATSAEAPDAAAAVQAKEAEALQALIEPPAALASVFSPALPPAFPPAFPVAAAPVTPAVDLPLVASTESAASFETSAAEVAALFAPSADSVGLDQAANARSSSMLVRLLQVINSPVSWISDAMRDALGKVALLTLFNAVAVLVYVLVFRRHGR